MARAGDRFTMPGGSSLVITRTSEETGGEAVEVEFTLAPGTSGPPSHRHPEQVEEWEVLEGTLSARRGGGWRSLGAGEKTSIPPGVVHTFRNESASPVRVRDVHRPALGFDDYSEALGRLVDAGKIKSARDLRSAIYFSMLWREHRRMQVAASPLLRAGMTLLAGLGRLLRFRMT
jgi:quercetin dioxygenase-like cupin family protein